MAPGAVAQRWDVGGWRSRLLIFKFTSSPGDSVTLWLPTSCRTAHTMLLVSPKPLPRTKGDGSSTQRSGCCPRGPTAGAERPETGASPAPVLWETFPWQGDQKLSLLGQTQAKSAQICSKKGKKVAFTPGTQRLAGRPLHRRIPPPRDLEGGPSPGHNDCLFC